MAAIINSGFDLITGNLQAGLPTIISEFVLADLPGLDHTQPINEQEVLPSIENIAWRGPITRAAAIRPDQVVYSLLLDGNVGDFNFNWIGLMADNGTLVAVAYVPRQMKFKYNDSMMGNTITRNFVLAFAGAQTALNIHISPETWQFDFTDYIDQRLQERLDMVIPPALERLDNAMRFAAIITDSSAEGDSRHLFMAAARLQLTASENGTSVLVAADHAVNVSINLCLVIAPPGEKIQTPQGPADECRLVATDQEFRFIRINGEYRV